LARNHDYPRTEQHLSQIIRELTYLDVHLEGSRTTACSKTTIHRSG